MNSVPVQWPLKIKKFTAHGMLFLQWMNKVFAINLKKNENNVQCSKIKRWLKGNWTVTDKKLCHSVTIPDLLVYIKLTEFQRFILCSSLFIIIDNGHKGNICFIFVLLKKYLVTLEWPWSYRLTRWLSGYCFYIHGPDHSIDKNDNDIPSYITDRRNWVNIYQCSSNQMCQLDILWLNKNKNVNEN